MFCPRCGRPVSRTANFCGGCGLPKSEIERMTQPQPEIKVQPVNREEIADIDATLSQLEGDLTGINPVVDYTTDAAVNTNAADNLLEKLNQKVHAEIPYRQKQTQPFSFPASGFVSQKFKKSLQTIAAKCVILLKSITVH